MLVNFADMLGCGASGTSQTELRAKGVRVRDVNLRFKIQVAKTQFAPLSPFPLPVPYAYIGGPGPGKKLGGVRDF